MRLDQGSSEEFEEVVELFRRAEEKLKLIERLYSGELIVPSVNELRYAGYHLVQAITADDSLVRSEEIKKAENHCKRACYDAIEVGVIDRLEAFKLFELDYKVVVVTTVLPDYVELRRVAREAKNVIESIDGLGDDGVNKRKECIYQEIEMHLNKLKDVVEKLDDARPELNKILAKKRTTAIVTGITLIVTTFAAIFGGVALFL